MTIIWVLETEVFKDSHNRLKNAVISSGHKTVDWDDEWLYDSSWPLLKDNFVVYHGSLANANEVKNKINWQPGVFCNTEQFECKNWYPQASKWLIHENAVFTTVKKLVDNPDQFMKELNATESIFVRPDSPLKPFSGRVIQKDDVSLKSLDHGFYYDDIDLPIVITSVITVGEEWRFVVSQNCIVASSSYEAADRSESANKIPIEVIEYAARIASEFQAPDPIYILDICECNGQLKLLEINPFSGADLYNCDRESIVNAITKVANG